MEADVQIARSSGAAPFNVHARCAASGSTDKQNPTAKCAADCAAVGGESGAARGRRILEERLAAIYETKRAAVVGDGRMVCGRRVEEFRQAGECAGADCGAVVVDSSTACGRAVVESREA